MIIKIRIATTKDISSILYIENCCFTSDQISYRHLKYLLTTGKSLVLIAEVSSKIIGYCIYLHPKLPKPARVYSVAVLQEWQGNGIAQKLMAHGIRKMATLGYPRVRLEVRARDLKTQKIYSKLGFQSISKLPSYYSDNADGIRMELLLIKNKARDYVF